MQVSDMQFWRSSLTYNGDEIRTFYLAETNTWFFVTSDICSVIGKISARNRTVFDAPVTAVAPGVKGSISIWEDKVRKTIGVLRKEELLELTRPIRAKEIRRFEQWIIMMCGNPPEGCFLQEDCKEYEFLSLATNRFMDIYQQINCCTFMDLPPEVRLYKIRDLFSVYTELLSYQPMQEYIKFVKETRPPMESVISSEFVKVVRNILAHFPLFSTWDDIYITKQLVNWTGEGRTIDKFFKKYQGHDDVQYRFKENSSGKWRYPTIKFPQEYSDNKIYLKDMANEADGVLLCAVLMYKVVSSQIISLPKTE